MRSLYQHNSAVIKLLLIFTNILYVTYANPGGWHCNYLEHRSIENSNCHLSMASDCLDSQNPSDGTGSLNLAGEHTGNPEMASRTILNVEFEVYGKVQGVFFRKNTVEQGKKLKLRGWCMNTSDGTVKGVMEGDPEKIKEMKHWLSRVGSKMSRIDKAEFRNEKQITSHSFKDFSVRY